MMYSVAEMIIFKEIKITTLCAWTQETYEVMFKFNKTFSGSHYLWYIKSTPKHFMSILITQIKLKYLSSSFHESKYNNITENKEE